QRTSWIASLSFTYPLGRVGEKARFRQAQLSLDRSSVTLRQLEQDILVRVRDAVRNVQTARESVALAQLAADFAAEQYDAESRRYRSGLSTSRFVLEAQTDLQ